MRETAIEVACAHLRLAISQSKSIASDDQIIMDHVKAAYVLLKVVRAGDRALDRAKWDPSQPVIVE